VEIINSAYTHCRPAIINIPTNGLLPQRTIDRVAAIATHCSDSQVVVNLSLDGWEEQHDHIRNIAGNFCQAMETYEGLQNLSVPNLTVGIHTVISRYNVDQIPELYGHIQSLSPDSYITEIAEKRVELDTIDSDIAPPIEPCTRALRFLRTEIGKMEADGIARITQAFRVQYYSMVERWLREQRQLIPCYAGWASAQISPEGEVWVCCIRAEPVGNLRQAAYDFRKVWFGEQIAPMRASVKNKECHCPLANASYTNMLCHYPSMVRVGAALVRTTLLHTRRSLSQAGAGP
jgi:sulfatase maturation enzyme AslB (radical SAM superfamily)